MAAADQYDMPELKTICADALAAGVTRANYVELLNIAELYNVKVLKAAVFGYINTNKGSLLA
jgi:hypothetical protein